MTDGRRRASVRIRRGSRAAFWTAALDADHRFGHRVAVGPTHGGRGAGFELGYVYRAAHRGVMTWQDAGQAARILREIRMCLESSDFEQRLRALEEAAAEQLESATPWSANGGDRRARH